MRGGVRYLLTGFLLGGVLVGAVFFVRARSPRPGSLAFDSPRTRGPADAPVQIIEYSDFQCPACRTAQSAIESLLEAHPGRIRFTFQHFPLDGHLWAQAAHQAAECAARQEKFWPLHDRLYRNQSDWSASPEVPIEIFIRYAKEAGVADLSAFGFCLTDPSAAGTIREEKRAGMGLGVRSTPSFFVNGELVVGLPELRSRVNKILQKGGEGPS